MEARTRMNEHLSDFDLAQALSLVTQAVPGVAGVYGGQLSAIATYGRGGRVPGIRVCRDAGQVIVEVYLTIAYTPALRVLALAETVRSRLRAELVRLAIDRVGAIDVVVADVEVPTIAREMRVL